jgi:phenylpropionate dioxygenase-like ring-hydroxylating dioxygenase large terminal subunit
MDAPQPNHVGAAGEASLYDALHRFWHPVMYANDLAGKPKGAVLLGEPVVLVRFADGVRAFRDLCVHRGTALSLGWLEDDLLVCAYHGWTYREDGRCVRIPARHGSRIPGRARLHGYPCMEKDGLIWVCLSNEPAFPVPEFPEINDPSFRVVAGPHYDWECSAPRRLENFVDFAHFAWVHEGVLGSRDNPEVPDHQVWREAHRLRFFAQVQEPISGVTKRRLGVQNEMVVVDNDYRLFMPLTIYLNRRFPGDNHYVLFMSSSPVGPKLTRNFWFIARNYALDDDDQEFLDFESLILEQDRPVVESQRPEELPVDLSAELHIKGIDQVSIKYRQWLIEIAQAMGKENGKEAEADPG